MVKYYIYAILLKDCIYSNNARILLEKYNIKHIIKIIDSENKDKYKIENYNTFPQIFLKKDDSFESLFLGGYTELNDIIINSYDNINVNKIQSKYKLSKKAVLRLIELIIKN